MKLSKALLSALLTGIAIQGLESCTKKLDSQQHKKTEQAEKNKQPQTPYLPGNCPACGMG